MNVPKAFWLVLVLPLILLVGVGVVFAQAEDPTEVEPSYLLVGGYDDEPVYVFEVGGRTCVRVGDSLECFCECTFGCDEYPTSTIPTPEGTPPPPTPGLTPPPPTVESTPGSNPTPRANCNRGIGNLDEDGCDPGNSYGQGQGGGRPAGEDRYESEGPPGNQHGNGRGGGRP